MIASGKDIHLEVKGKHDDIERTAIEIARDKNRKGIVSLLKRFSENQEQIRQEIRIELGLAYIDAAELFATIVFLCDSYFAIKSDNKAARFFRIIRTIPMEIQMVVCNRVYGSKKETILSSDSEKAFGSIVRTFC